MIGALKRALYRYTPRPLPSVGTGNLAFEPSFSLPAQPVQGPGTPYRVSLDVTQPVQVWHNQALTMTDVGGGGLPAGTFEQQPLIDMEAYIQNVASGV